jgi:methionine-rich copper-binding protein CopC
MNWRKTRALRKLPIISAILFLFTPPTWVGAHAELESSNPGAESVLSVMPESISLTFSEALITLEGEKVNTIALSDPTGRDIPLSPSVVENTTLSTEIADLASNTFVPGEYKITYRVVSADGHPISGSISFTLKPDESAPTGSDSTQSKSEITSVTEQNTPTSSGNTSLILIATLVFLAIGGFFIIRKK